MSESTPSPSSPQSSPSSSSNAQNLAFLVHSPTTVANSLPPDVDNKSLARQKRRRTSKEDEDILKEEYQKNPKPDRVTRQNIVSKVALGEKEVQIWFQNKRQNDRRRSRPLDASSSDPPAHDESKSQGTGTGEPAAEEHRENQLPTRELSAGAVVSAAVSEPLTDAPKSPQLTRAFTVLQTTTTLLDGSSNSQPNASFSQSRTSWISNRRSASFRFSEDYEHEPIAFPNPNRPAKPASNANSKSLKRTRSLVRISTNQDGTARIITDQDKTPSPPKATRQFAAISRTAASLRRSYSGTALSENVDNGTQRPPSPKMPRTSLNAGRSRDSRAWEFWCDPETRSNTSLTIRADQETSGSAADAIGLLRANRKVLSQNNARQNAPMLSRHSSGKMSHANGVRKPRGTLQRSSTTHGCLQTKSHTINRSDASSPTDTLQTESDKENWEPKDSQPSTITTLPRSRKALGENTEILSQTFGLNALTASEEADKSTDARKGSDPELDEELRRFMGNTDTGVSMATTVSSAEEAGCVEGLLKLSQGHWR